MNELIEKYGGENDSLRFRIIKGKYTDKEIEKVKNINRIRVNKSKKLQAKGEEPLDRYEFDYLLLCNKFIK